MKEPKVFLAVPKVITILEAEQSALPTAEECPYLSVVSFYGARRFSDESQEEAGKSVVPEFVQLYASSLEELEKVTIELIKSSIAELKLQIEQKDA